MMTFRTTPRGIRLTRWGVDPAGSDIAEQALRRGSLEIAAREPAIVIAVSRQPPTLVLLAVIVGLAGFALRRERIESCSSPSSEDLRV
jgi:hypothetical protein